jgi:hypothetical protein
MRCPVYEVASLFVASLVLWDLLGCAAAFGFGLMVEGCWQCLAYPASKIVNVLE